MPISTTLRTRAAVAPRLARRPQQLLEDLAAGEVAAEAHRARRAERAARAQPDCDETQTARRSPSASAPSRSGTRPACGTAPSPSVGGALLLVEDQFRERQLARQPRAERLRERGHLVPGGAARSRVTPCRTCSLRYDGSPQSASSDIAVSSCTKARVSMILDPVVAQYLDALYPASDPVLAEMEAQGAADRRPDRDARRRPDARSAGPRRGRAPGDRVRHGNRRLDPAPRAGRRRGRIRRLVRRRPGPAGDGARLPRAGRRRRPRRPARSSRRWTGWPTSRARSTWRSSTRSSPSTRPTSTWSCRCCGRAGCWSSTTR